APAERVLLIQAGLVQIVRHAATGDDHSIALFGPRELVGLTAVLERAPYPAEAVVVSERAELWALPAAALERIAAEDLGFARALTTALLEHTRALRAKIAMVTSGDTAQRLAVLFAHLAERFGDEDARGVTFIPLALTRRMLGQLVGARTETVIRVLSKWQQAGLVSTTPAGFEIRALAALGAAD
ncbi:MAG: Crp/Fnr family transcriptional regulator, partial [Deltaproteobacteria bacterium]|nr:Crp/Fnr family transcriptional regulator [Deltaproteobacteria bacterium]